MAPVYSFGGRGQAGRLAAQITRSRVAPGRLTLNCRNTRPIARHTAVVSNTEHRVKARVDGPPVEFIPYREKTGWGGNLERVINDIRREGINPGQVSVLLARNPDEQEAKVLERLSIQRLTEDTVPALGTTALDHMTWSTASGFKGLENDAVILVGIKDVEKEWSRGVAYVGMSRARTRLYVILTDECDRERQRRLQTEREQRSSDVEMLL